MERVLHILTISVRTRIFLYSFESVFVVLPFDRDSLRVTQYPVYWQSGMLIEIHLEYQMKNHSNSRLGARDISVLKVELWVLIPKPPP